MPTVAAKLPTPELTALSQSRHRASIQTGIAITQLNKCVAGEITLTPIQVRAAEILLRKTLPDLSAIQLNLENNATGQTLIIQLPQALHKALEHQAGESLGTIQNITQQTTIDSTP